MQRSPMRFRDEPFEMVNKVNELAWKCMNITADNRPVTDSSLLLPGVTRVER